MSDRPTTMTMQPLPAFRSLPDRALDSWVRNTLQAASPAPEEQSIPAELLALVRSGHWD